MAEQRQKSSLSAMEEEMYKIKAEREQAEKKKQFEKRIQTLAEKAADFAMSYGMEDFRTQMMMTFLDVALEMKEMIEMITGVNTAMSCIFEAISFIDMAIDFNQSLQEESLKHNYGFFARWKAKRRLKKVIRNNANRIRVTMDNMRGQIEMANLMTDEMRRTFEKMQATLAKSNAKRQKKQEKKGPAPAPLTKGRAHDMIAEIIASRGGKVETPTTPTTPSSDDYSDL